MSDEIGILGDPDDAPPEARAVFQRAEFLRESGNFNAALEDYREAITLHNFFIPAYLWILKLVPREDRNNLTAEVRDSASRVLVFGTPDQYDEVHELLGADSAKILVKNIISDYNTFVEISPNDYDTRYQLTCFLGRTEGNDKLYEEGLEGLMEEFPDESAAYITAYAYYIGFNKVRATEIRRICEERFGEKEILDEIDDILRYLSDK